MPYIVASASSIPTTAVSAEPTPSKAASASAKNLCSSTSSQLVTITAIADSSSSCSSIATVSAANSSVTTTASTVTTKSTLPPILPSRPVRPYCPADKNEPMRELPYFLEELRFKVHYYGIKEFKVRHKATASNFAKQMQIKPELLLKSKNYACEETS